MEIAPAEFRSLEKMNITACGTSWHAGSRRKSSLSRAPWPASQWKSTTPANGATCDPIIGANTITMVISQSGETADTIAAQREAKAEALRLWPSVT